jgi:hypothetical protein
MRRLAAWALGIAFISGFLGRDGVFFAALATFVLAFDQGRTPWRWAVVSLTAWAAGVGVGMLLTLLGQSGVVASPAQAGSVVLATYASAFAATWVKWVATRLARQP